MAIKRQQLVYDGPGGPFEGVAAWDDAVEGARPGVLVLPNFLGQKEQDNVTAERLAALGYAAFACDLFGQGKRARRGDPDVADLMNVLNGDRTLLKDRLTASLDAFAALPQVDAARVAAIGFCFGGKCAVDLARFGAPVLGVVSFHGLYDRPDYPTVSPMRAKLLVCHGWDDPLAPPEAVTGLGKELTDAAADWQIHAYGGAGHGFTDETAQKGNGFGYDEPAARRSWAAMRDFLGELFG